MITIVFGKPGSGKTAYLTANAVKYLNNSKDSIELYERTCAAIDELNVSGLNYSYPVHAPVYTNYELSVKFGRVPGNTAYFVNGFYLGFECNANDGDVINVYPGSKIYLSEAQRIFNSRSSSKLADWVSRYYEEHRHFDLDIMLDVQRPGLIDVNIREIADEYITVDKIEQIKDKFGIVRKTIFYLKAFSEYKYVEKYIADNSKCYERRKEVFNFNPFSYYKSKSYYKSFLPIGEKDFWHREHLQHVDPKENVKLFKIMYEQSPPDSFYKRK